MTRFFDVFMPFFYSVVLWEFGKCFWKFYWKREQKYMDSRVTKNTICQKGHVENNGKVRPVPQTKGGKDK